MVTTILALAGLMRAASVSGFSLMGPYEAWMDTTNGFRNSSDIGGPMDPAAGYRWNVPVLTYGFDRSFLDYFGSNGVQAVEAAIEILNNLPAASTAVLTNFPTFSQRENYYAEANGLRDLKSAALAVLVEQLGLAQPTRYVFSVRRWDASLEPFAFIDAGLPGAPGIIPNYVVEKNFDPETLLATNVVNEAAYTAYISYTALGSNGVPAFADAVEVLIDPLDFGNNAVADDSLSFGMFYTGLTYDDVGGLKFLLNTNNLRVESLPMGIRAAASGQTLVNTALRPGVDKIRFISHPLDAMQGAFLPLTNQFTDTYFANGQALLQQVERVISQPDFLFTAGDTGKDSPGTPYLVRTGTSNWVNNSQLNGATHQAGPGVIVPPVTITFHQLGPWIISQEPDPEQNSYTSRNQWGWFDLSTNLPVAFPQFSSGATHPLQLRFRLFSRPNSGIPVCSYTWQFPVPIGGTILLQTSTNLSDWRPVASVTNNGTIPEWQHSGGSQTARFFRAVPVVEPRGISNF